jgi:hypothetical protein
MVKVRKTGKSLNINLTDTIKLLRFLENFMFLDIVDRYLSYLGEKLVPLSSIKSDTLTIYPKYVLVPTTQYYLSFIDVEANLGGVRIMRKRDIEIDKPVQFDEYEFIEYSWGPWSKVEIGFHISFYENEKKIGVGGVSIKVKSYTGFGTCYCPLYFNKDSAKLRYVEEGLKAFIESNGKKFEEVERESPAAALKIGILEDAMFLSLNVLYSIYNGVIKEDTIEYKIFAPFTKILHSYGKNFEEVLSIIKEFSIIL